MLRAVLLHTPGYLSKRNINSHLPRQYRDSRCRHFFHKIIKGDEAWCFAYEPDTKREFWMGLWHIQETEIPKVPHQENVDNFSLFSRIRTRGKSSKSRILQRSNVSPPEAHSTGSSNCILLTRFFSCYAIMRLATKLKVFGNFWPQKNVTTIYHHLYSPDLSPLDYFLFPKIKIKLKRFHFVDIDEIHEAESV